MEGTAVLREGEWTGSSLKPGYFPALDGLRALAFLMVFSFHYLQVPWGWAGVDVFFVLSGFLITGILFDTHSHPHRVRNFYVRRTLRIFPLYYGLIVLLVLLYPLFRWEWNTKWLLWPAYLGNFAWFFHPIVNGSPLFMLANGQFLSRTYPHVELVFGHFWSLCIEEQFYLVWPWVVFWIGDRRKLIYVCVACVVGCPVLRIVAGHVLPHYWIEQGVRYYATPFRVDALLIGGWIALVLRGPSARSLVTMARAGLMGLSLAMLLWVALSPAARHGRIGYVYPAWRDTWGMTFIDLFSGCLIVLALEYGSVTFRIFNLSWLRWLGRISYGLYVFHYIPHLVFIRIAARYTRHNGTPAAVLAFATTLLLAWASYRWFETPFIRLKERWTR
jgi:peptidoglycan/LPS O-acetylase OafA/YrhL